MLATISISCPKCRETTELSVSRNATSGMSYSTTSCRACRARFIAVTQEDGQVLLLDGDAPPDPSSAATVRVLAVIGSPSRSGYRVVPPPHLGIFDRGVPPSPAAGEPVGVSDEALSRVITIDGALLRRPDGSRRAPAEAAKFVGWRSVWMAQLNVALRDRLAGPPPLSFPPGVFVSYRWGTATENEWTADLASRIKARGYPVIFDREKPGDLDVPGMVSQIADCRYFLAVLDPGYAERLGTDAQDEATKDGWVFDEFNTAAFLSNHGQLRILGLLRKGAGLPRGFRHPEPGRPGNVLDGRTPEQLALVLDEAFPPIDPAPDAKTVTRARALLRASHEHLCAGRFQEAFNCAGELTVLLPGVVDGTAQQVRVALRAGSPAAGWQAAEEGLKLAPESRELMLAAGSFAGDVGQHQRAVVHLAALLEAPGDDPSLNLATAHYALGSSLDEFDQVYPAIAHLEIARGLQPADPVVHNTLGFVYRRAGEVEQAIQCLNAGLRHDPGHVDLLVNLTAASIEAGHLPDARRALAELAERAPGHRAIEVLRECLDAAGASPGQAPGLVAMVPRSETALWCRCNECAARVPVEGLRASLCARCGSSLPIEPDRCPNCEGSGRIFPAAPHLTFQCPYCRRGTLAMADRQTIEPALPPVRHARGG